MKVKDAFLRTLVLALIITPIFVFVADAQESVTDQVRCYTTWDENYLFLAFKVDSPDVSGTHSVPNADVTGDDCVAVYIDTASKRPDKIAPSSFAMVVSAAGGARFMQGTEQGDFTPVTVWSFKYGVAVQGTINNSDDIDQGYSIEMAIPWDVLKTRAPGFGDMIGFNFVVRRAGEKSEIASFSTKVKSDTDIGNPQNWANAVFAAYSYATSTLNRDKMVSAKYVLRPPLINGVISEKEWNSNTSFAIDLPNSGVMYEAKFPVHKLVLSPYFYWYQADRRRDAQTSKIEDASGRPMLTTFPTRNVGPWVSYDRVQWHKEELSDAAAAGIDVILPVYWGDKSNKSNFARKGLDCLVAALGELRSEGKPYPLLGMFLDTHSFEAAYRGKPDLREEEAKRGFYGMIKDFYDRVPPEFRAVVQAGKPAAGRASNLVFLHSAEHFAELDPAIVQYCIDRFEKDFGYRLVWVASFDYKGKLPGVDGYFDHGAPTDKPRIDFEGRIHIATVGPGYDNSGVVPLGKASIVSRMNGGVYENEWAAVFERKPHWVVCDSWNGFLTGSELCSSRQYGRKYLDATRAKISKFHGEAEYDAQYVRYNVPITISQRQFATAEFVIKNNGSAPWRLADGYALAYRWFKGGRYYGESKVRRPLEREVLPGQSITVNIGIATVTSQGASLPDGDSEIRFELIRLSDGKWFSALGDQPLVVPVTIGKPDDYAFTCIGCDVPNMVASDRSYPCTIRLRNDGALPWRQGVTKLGVTLYKVCNYTHDEPREIDEPVPIREMRALLSKDCKPGEIAEFKLDLRLVGADKNPLPAWKQTDPWSYQLRFDLFNGSKWLSEIGHATINRTIDVFDNDYGARIVDADVPRKLGAGQTLQVKVVIRNMGTDVWSRKRVKVGYHWYHLDGIEMDFNGQTTPIKTDLKPGLPLVTTAMLKTPDYDGQYVLVWDVMIDDQWLSTQPLVRGGDILPQLIEITSGKLSFVDLADLYDTVAVSPDTERNAGDFDGRGYSYPAEYFPPDASVDSQVHRIYPTGYNCDHTPKDGRISFMYPEKGVGRKTAVACASQKVLVAEGAYKSLHILGASSGQDASGEFSLNYTDGAVPVSLQMNDWSAAPTKGGSLPALVVRHRHSHGGDDNSKPCYLNHYTVALDPSRVLTSVTLPKNHDMKIVAITLERSGLPPVTK